VLTHAPVYNETALVGCPINAILDWAMGTHAGFAAFLNDRVNAQLKKVLNEWGIFLRSADSASVLNDTPAGWLGREALAKMPHFAEDFVCDPAAPHYGFTSWDDFFTRRLRPGARPVASPGDPDVVVNACESAPYRLRQGVRRRDHFWVKGQPYSVAHMLADDPWADAFVGGTIYQAFLSPLSYHRWHSPVDGRIAKAYVQDGTYYSETPAEGYDPSGGNFSQAYLTEVATRAMLFIEADNPAIGLMCVLAVGMAEVSTCEITVYQGQRVKKGDQLGMFHFGGSTHCLMFGSGVSLDFDLHGQKPGLRSRNIPVNARIATVVR
jgi:phosphatidylserine decarboxylase